MSRAREIWAGVRGHVDPRPLALGPLDGGSFRRDPKRLLFLLSRYKFAAKTLRGATRILDAGCGEGLGAYLLFRETGAAVDAVDFDAAQIGHAAAQFADPAAAGLRFHALDLVHAAPPSRYDALCCLDVIEHLPPDEAGPFLDRLLAALDPGGRALFGTPNLAAAAHASAASRAGHVNLFDAERFRATLAARFATVVLFAMNDEVVHTGHLPMAHYLLALCVK